MFGVPLWIALCTLIAASAAVRDMMAVRAGCILLLNWAANTGLAQVSGNQFNWVGMATFDYLAAILILLPPTTFWQALISGLYGVELAFHFAFAASGGNEMAQYRYWWRLHYAAWAQAAVLGVWMLHGGLKIRRHAGGPRGSVSPVPEMLVRADPSHGSGG